ncbi:Cytochrome P450 4V2-like protein, partial [Leptotrombidium deliense]
NGKKSKPLAKELHVFTIIVVENRRKQLLKEREEEVVKDIREEVDTFTFAGHDTTGSAVTWTLFEIGHNDRVQRKIHQEVDDIFGEDRTSPITNEELKKLHYLEWIWKKTVIQFLEEQIFGSLSLECK